MSSERTSHRFVLASGSPRRKQLLEQLGLAFTIDAADIDESVRPEEPPALYVERLAVAKAAAVEKRHPGEIVLAADTTVSIDGDILGKPVDDAEARAMLKRLSTNTHEVFTGIAAGGRSRVVRTAVRFRALSDAEIAWYVSTGEPHDKAGAYGMQGRAAAFIEAIEGSPTSVIGLPLAETLQLLREAGLALPW